VLTLVLFFTGLVGKVLAALALVPSQMLSPREAPVVGVGLNARLTTDVVVAQLLLTAGIIDLEMFTALVAASSPASTTIPIAPAFMARRWHSDLGMPAEGNARPVA